MLKKFFAGIFLLMMISAQASAMNFQDPVEIGTVSQAGGRENAIEIKGADKIEATTGSRSNCYVKGFAIFNRTLYLHFDGNARNNGESFFGGADAKNSVPVYVFEGWTQINRLGNDAGLEMYFLLGETGGGGSFEVIGLRDGKWVKYFDTLDANKQIENGFFVEKVFFVGDTIIFLYKHWQRQDFCELRYKWDAAARWFGVEIRR